MPIATRLRPAWLVLVLWLATVNAAGQLAIGVQTQGSLLVGQDKLAGEARIEAFDSYGVTIADLDGDGRPELIAMNDNSRVYVIDTATHRVRAEITTAHPGGKTAWHTQSLNGVAVADMDGDGLQELLILNSGGMLTRLERDPDLDTPAVLGLRKEWAVLAHAPAFQPRFWDERPWFTPTKAADTPQLAHSAAVVAAPAPEAAQSWVYVQSDGLSGQFAFDHEGRLQWLEAWQDGHAGPWVGAMGGRQTVLFASDAGELTARNAQTGQLVWQRQVGPKVSPGSHSVGPVVADLDGDGRQEIFVAARNVASGVDWMQRSHAQLELLDDQGALLWSVQHPEGNPMVHSRAIPHDVNRDGVLDLVVLDWNTIGRKPGNWERLGPGNLFGLDGRNGSVLWSIAIEAPATDFDLALADTDEGRVALVPHAVAGRHGLATIQLDDGRLLAWQELPDGWNTTRGATLVPTSKGGWEAWVAMDRPGLDCAPKEDVACRDGAFAVLPLRTSGPTPQGLAPAALPSEALEAVTGDADPLAAGGVLPLAFVASVVWALRTRRD
ncbi:MAG: FG-GAP-like repeat-containing protein [Candidatus Thermoplasmatota archaeon]